MAHSSDAEWRRIPQKVAPSALLEVTNVTGCATAGHCSRSPSRLINCATVSAIFASHSYSSSFRGTFRSATRVNADVAPMSSDSLSVGSCCNRERRGAVSFVIVPSDWIVRPDPSASSWRIEPSPLCVIVVPHDGHVAC